MFAACVSIHHKLTRAFSILTVKVNAFAARNYLSFTISITEHLLI